MCWIYPVSFSFSLPLPSLSVSLPSSIPVFSATKVKEEVPTKEELRESQFQIPIREVIWPALILYLPLGTISHGQGQKSRVYKVLNLTVLGKGWASEEGKMIDKENGKWSGIPGKVHETAMFPITKKTPPEFSGLSEKILKAAEFSQKRQSGIRKILFWDIGSAPCPMSLWAWVIARCTLSPHILLTLLDQSFSLWSLTSPKCSFRVTV